MAYRLFKHKAYDESLRRLPPAVRHKATWAQVLLGIRGRTPSVKGTRGLNARWRRTPVQGNHYYMWWIPRSEGEVAGTAPDPYETNTILIHSIRHHDETDIPIDAGSLADYEEIALAQLDPRYEEQLALSQEVRSEQVALATIKGLPGSGKTVSLLYLVKDLAQRPGINKLLYVTYSSRLKRAAREFLLAQDESISQAVTIRTLAEIEKELTGQASGGEPFTELRDFMHFLNAQNPSLLGVWRRYPQVLYTEIRAHLLGKTFPANFVQPNEQATLRISRVGDIDASLYAAARDLPLPAATLLVNFADRLQSGRFFQDQRAATRAIELLQRGRMPGWLAQLDGLIVDEVQDLTLVQIGLLGELVRARMRRQPDAPFVFSVAGDESQIVQPSGFDWGVTKDLLGEQIGIWPQEFEFRYQRRSPENLAQLIDNSWGLYGRLPRALRPSARRQTFEPAAADEAIESYGRILCCPPPSPTAEPKRWSRLLAELADKPGRVLVDLSETLRTALADQLGPDRAEIIMWAREIKGLERATVLIYGLNTLYERAQRLCASPEDDNLPLFEARRLFDEIRVALSRSTEKLILLESADAPSLEALGVPELVGVGELNWEAMIDTLQTEELSELEVIENFLDEVDELFDRAFWAEGLRRNRRAHELAQQIGDLALQREVQEQFIRGHLLQGASLLNQADERGAFAINRTALQLASDFGDPVLLAEVEDQKEEIATHFGQQIQQHLAEADRLRQLWQLTDAQQRLQCAAELSALLEDPQWAAQVDEAEILLMWEWAGQAAATAYTPHQAREIAERLLTAAAALARQGDVAGEQAARLLADRYQQLPQREALNERQVTQLLTFAEQYLALIEPLNMGSRAYDFVEYWLKEAFAGLQNHTALFARWGLLAQELVYRQPNFDPDEQMWDLENRLKLLLERGQRSASDPEIARFQALLAVYHGDTQGAAELWETLGDFKLAAEFAREAGDLERSFRLLHQAKSPIPEELATAVKAIRLLQQLERKHRGLRSAEQASLLAALDALRTAIQATAAEDSAHSPPPADE